MDISHGCFSGPTARFDGLRLLWSEMAGYGVSDFRDQGGPVMPNVCFSNIDEMDSLGEWPGGAPDDPLLILLVHEETAGRIKWQHCPYLADRLEELEMKMMGHTTPDWLLLTQQFIRGLRAAAHYRQDVVFS